MRTLVLTVVLAMGTAIQAQTWHPVGSGASSTVYSLEVFADELYAGGLFTGIGGVSTNYLARWNGAAWGPVANLITYMAADGLQANDTALFIGDGGRVRWWNGTGLYNLTGVNSSSFNSTVYAIAHYQDTLYCGGFFSSPFAHIAKWNGMTYESVTSGCNAQVSLLTPFGDQLFVAGNFQVAGDSLVNRTALWDGVAWNRMGAGVNNDVFAHCFYRDTLYIGGRFTAANGATASRVAKWNGSQWVAVGGTLNDYVTAMAVYRDQLYIGGAFTTPSRIARLQGSTWVPVGSGCNERVRTMEVYHDTLFVGGDFTVAGGIAADRIAKWHLPEPPVATVSIEAATVCPGECTTFTDLSPNGVATRIWTFPGGVPATSTDSIVTVCYADPGTYVVTLSVTNAGGTDVFSDPAAITVEVCTGIAAHGNTRELRVFPAPASGMLTIEWRGGGSTVAWLVNATGQLVEETLVRPGRTRIDISGLVPGVYIMRTSDGRSARVVVE